MIPSFGIITQTLNSKSYKNRRFHERYYPSLEKVSMVPDNLYLRPLSTIPPLFERIIDSLDLERKRYGEKVCIEIATDIDSEGTYVKVIPIKSLNVESMRIRRYGIRR